MLGKLITAASLFSIGFTAQAKELLGPEAGVVPYGMGRAYSAVADDWLALHYNPAGLALVKNIDLQAFDLKLETSKDVISSANNLTELSKSSSSTTEKLNNLAGKNIRFKAGNISQVTLPNFAFGAVYDVNTGFSLENPAYPNTTVRYTKDLSLIMGFAAGVGRKKNFRFGATAKYMNRQGGEQSIGIDEISTARGSLLDRFSEKGWGYGGDLGVQYTFPSGRRELTLAYVWHDIGKTSFGSYKDPTRPTRVEDNMVAGLSYRIPIGGKVNRRRARRYGQPRSTNHLTFAADYSHINFSPEKEQYAKHLHFGMNLDLPLLSLQFGVNQSSITLGTTFDVGILRVSAATYGEELGSYAGQNRDRRYVLSISSAFGSGKF